MNQTLIVLVVALGAGGVLWYVSRKPEPQGNGAGANPPIVPNVPNGSNANGSLSSAGLTVCGYAVTVGAASQGVPVPPQVGTAACKVGSALINKVGEFFNIGNNTNCSVRQIGSNHDYCRSRFPGYDRTKLDGYN